MASTNPLPDNTASQFPQAIRYEHAVADTPPQAPSSIESLEIKEPHGTSEDALPISRWKAWSKVLVSFLLVFNGFGYFSSFGLFEQHWTEVLHKSNSDIAWVGSLSLFLLFSMGTISGILMDRGYFREILFAGCAAQLIGVFTTSVVNQFWQLILTQGILQGLGNGLLFTPAVTLVTANFDANRNTALSIAACGAPIGGIVFSVMAQQLLKRGVPFPLTVQIMGFVMLFNMALIFALGFRRFSMVQKGKEVNEKEQQEKRPRIAFTAFKDPVYTFFAVGVFFTLWGIYIAYFFTSTYGRNVIGVPASDSLTLLIILNVVGLPGRVVPAYLADRFFGPFNTMLPFVLSSSILLLVWMRVETISAYDAWVVLYGISANAVQTLFPSTLSSLTTDPETKGQSIGMVFTVGGLACLTGPPIAGQLISVGHGSYIYLQIFGGVSVLTGFVFFSISRFCQIVDFRAWTSKTVN